MNKAYIILVHKNPHQLERLIQKLDDGESDFFVHIDKNTSIQEFEFLFRKNINIEMVKRVAANWGSFGLVQATINAMRAIKENNKVYQRITLLSGQDYPIKSNDFINQYFSDKPYSNFIEHFTIPNEAKWQPRGGLYRIDKYFFGLSFSKRYTAKLFNFASSFLPFVKRKMPYNLVPYAGSQWWTIDDYALNYILNFISAHPKYVAYHKYTFAPDEVFFHTILLNAKDERIQKSIANNHVRYINWPDLRKGHPKLLEKSDFIDMIQSDALFARKFDLDANKDIFDMIDKNCLN